MCLILNRSWGEKGENQVGQQHLVQFNPYATWKNLPHKVWKRFLLGFFPEGEQKGYQNNLLPLAAATGIKAINDIYNPIPHSRFPSHLTSSLADSVTYTTIRLIVVTKPCWQETQEGPLSQVTRPFSGLMCYTGCFTITTCQGNTEKCPSCQQVPYLIFLFCTSSPAF